MNPKVLYCALCFVCCVSLLYFNVLCCDVLNVQDWTNMCRICGRVFLVWMTQLSIMKESWAPFKRTRTMSTSGWRTWIQAWTRSLKTYRVSLTTTWWVSCTLLCSLLLCYCCSATQWLLNTASLHFSDIRFSQLLWLSPRMKILILKTLS